MWRKIELDLRTHCITFDDVSYLFTYSCYFTLVKNPAILADKTSMMLLKLLGIRFDYFLLNDPLPTSPQVIRAIAL